MSKVLRSAEKVSLGSASVSNKFGARAAISKVDEMLEEVSGARAFLGATQTRIQATIQNLGVSEENTLAVNARIRDTDVAKATAQRAISSLKTDASTSFLAHANTLPGKAKQLIE